MENLNAENVKKWLEVCAEDTPYPDQSQALLEALALITSQEQRIKELAEENKAWQKQLISTEEKADKAYYDLACEVEELRSENEDLKAQCQYTTEAFHSVKADTVRKMQERLKAEAKNNEWNGTICGEDIDQIAKEMLEGDK